MYFYDLRHAGNHNTASAGANLRELTERMGLVTFLVYPPDDLVLVVQIQWLGE